MAGLSSALQTEFPYVNGLVLSFASTTTLSVSTGFCSNSLTNLQMSLGTATTINAAVNGLNGLDTGSLGATKWYYAFLIGDSTGLNVTGTILSLSPTAPLMPAGYDILRLIGIVPSNGSSLFPVFYTTGNGSGRKLLYDALISVLSGGTATSFTAVDCSAAVPPIANTPINLNVSFTPNTAADASALRPTGSSSTNGLVIYTGDVASKAAQFPNVDVLGGIGSSKAEIDYKVAASGALTLLVGGFTYYI